MILQIHEEQLKENSCFTPEKLHLEKDQQLRRRFALFSRVGPDWFTSATESQVAGTPSGASRSCAPHVAVRRSDKVFGVSSV